MSAIGSHHPFHQVNTEKHTAAEASKNSTLPDLSNHFSALSLYISTNQRYFQRILKLPSGGSISLDTLYNEPLFIKDHEKRGKIFTYLSSILNAPLFKEKYQSFIESDLEANLSLEDIPALSIIAFLDKDIDLKKLIEINTKSESTAEAFINKTNLQLCFSHGRVFLSDFFFNDPLFKDLKEKKSVFIKLFYLLNSPSFPVEYNLFLSKRNNKNLFEIYNKEPEKLTLLSILAFYNAEISGEELLIINNEAHLNDDGFLHFAANIEELDIAE